ncbi:MarR family winged helix-turn-helix transcriptional regulator [Streptacidiphilus sp. P02-A3a]|uniref:MarR family winged helix-turn-helix transcriptional regulator n=1 Tax=Streptacidiphilus sp. P02-A3a TaxID=2704468 RepID=UPI00351A6904
MSSRQSSTPETTPPQPDPSPVAPGTGDGNEPAAHQPRAESIDAIQRELTAFARRSRSQASQIHPGLTLVTYAILDLLRERGGCRGTDLAAHFMLDKSTVSRQVTALERLGLVERSTDPEDQRGQIIRTSTQGSALLQSVSEQRRLAFLSRLADWPDEDLERFASYLTTYNSSYSSPTDTPTGQR